MQDQPEAAASQPEAAPGETIGIRRLFDCQVAIIGAGVTGLVAALDLHKRGVRDVLVFDQAGGPAPGSRAFWWSRRSLEILARLGVTKIAAEGVTWRSSHVLAGERELFRFDPPSEAGHKLPPFIDYPQDALEAALHEQLAIQVAGSVAWRHRLTGIAQLDDRVALTFATDEGERKIEALYVIAADGGNSAVRRALGLSLVEPGAEENVILADVRVPPSTLPPRRLLWLRPTFHEGPSAAMHPLPGGLARIELQLPPDAVPVTEAQPGLLVPRLRKLLGQTPDIVWTGIHSVRPGWLRHFVHGRVLFAGDAARLHSRLSGQGANSGIQDIDNLAWKLALVIQGRATTNLLESYDSERGGAAENLAQIARAADFIAPAPGMPTVLRDAVLDLASTVPFARSLIALGRLPGPVVFETSPLNGPDELGEPRGARPGAVCPNAPVRFEDETAGHLLDRLGAGFTVIQFLPKGSEPSNVYDASVKWSKGLVPIRVIKVGDASGRLDDVEGLVASRLAGAPGAAVVLRPDQHVLARFAHFDAATIEAAVARGLANPGGTLPVPPPTPAKEVEVATSGGTKA